MKIYTLSQQGIAKMRRQLIWRMGIFFAVVMGLSIAAGIWANPHSWISVLFTTIAIIVIFAFFFMSRTLKQSKEMWKSLKFEVTDDYIAASQVRGPSVRIHRNEITSIDKYFDLLCVRTADKMRTLAVPGQGFDEANYQEIKQQLASWAPIQPPSAKSKIYNIVISVVVIIGFGILFFVPSIWLTLVVGILLAGYFGYTCWEFRRDPKMRSGLLFSIFFIIFITLLKIGLLSSTIISWLLRLRSS